MQASRAKMGTGVDPTIAHIPTEESADNIYEYFKSTRTTKVTIKASQAESSSADARMPLLDKAV